MSGGNLITTVTGVPNANGETFANSFILFPCYGAAGQDCLTTPTGVGCPNQNTSLPMIEQGLQVHNYFQLGGTPGTNYRVTINVNGITEGKYYMGGTRAAPNPADPQILAGTDTFYTGGDPVNQENYNIYQLMVRQAPTTPGNLGSGAEVQHYYMNSFPTGTNFPYENHNTFPLAFTHDIIVPGGGVIEFHLADRNCHAIDNCGPGNGRTTDCMVAGDGARTVPNEPTLAIPANYMGKPTASINTRNGAAQPWHSQIIHIRVMNVVAM